LARNWARMFRPAGRDETSRRHLENRAARSKGRKDAVAGGRARRAASVRRGRPRLSGLHRPCAAWHV